MYVPEQLGSPNRTRPARRVSTSTSTVCDIRRALIAEEGCVFVAADYCQLEVRLLAHLCEDR